MSSRSIKKTGIAPRLFFIIGEEDDYRVVLLELTITDDEFKEMPLGKESNMHEEVIDIGYADSEGWLTLPCTNSTLKVTKLDLDKFLIKFKCEDQSEDVSIEIDEEIMLDFP